MCLTGGMVVGAAATRAGAAVAADGTDTDTGEGAGAGAGAGATVTISGGTPFALNSAKLSSSAEQAALLSEGSYSFKSSAVSMAASTRPSTSSSSKGLLFLFKCVKSMPACSTVRVRRGMLPEATEEEEEDDDDIDEEDEGGGG